MNIPLSVPQYFSIGFALIVLARAIHYLTVTRYLKERGVAVARTGTSISDWEEWMTYRRMRLSDHRPLVWWYVLLAIQITLLFWVAGWLANGVGGIRIAKHNLLGAAASVAGDYATVFDVSRDGYRHVWFAASGLIFVAAGLVLPLLFRIDTIAEPAAWKRRWFPPVFVGFGILWTLVTFTATRMQISKRRRCPTEGTSEACQGPRRALSATTQERGVQCAGRPVRVLRLYYYSGLQSHGV